MYGIENGTGDLSGEGMTIEQAMKAAQEEANRVGATRYVIDMDGDEEPVAVNPARFVGVQAVDYAEEHGLALSKYADPTEDARDDLSIGEAREIIREDAGLVYVDVVA